MIEYQELNFEGLKCIQLRNPKFSVWITTEVGPRVIGLALDGGENLMVVLPDAKIPVENGADFTLYGGHRLWYAPERPETTYLPDDQPLEVERIPGGVNLIQQIDQATGIQKSWKVVLDESNASLKIDHQLRNTSAADFTLAPWAVTMLRPGGVGMIPLQQELSDPHGLWPNRQLAFWPYADLRSPHLKIENKAVYIEAKLSDGAIKVGAPNPIGWIAYQLDGTLFVKHAPYDPEAVYLDRRASSQIYCNPTVIELETLGPMVDLAHGETITHQEIWEVYGKDDWPDEIGQYFDQI